MEAMTPEVCASDEVQFLATTYPQQPQTVNYNVHNHCHFKTQLAQCNENFREIKENQQHMKELTKQWNLYCRWQNLRNFPLFDLKPNLWPDIPNIHDSHIVCAVNYLQDGSNLHKVGCAILVASTINSSFHGRVIVDCDENGWHEPGILRSFQCGESGLGKTTVFQKLIQPLLEYEDTYNNKLHPSATYEEREIISDLLQKERSKSIKGISLRDLDSLKRIKQIADELENLPAVRKIRRQKLTLLISSAKVNALRHTLSRNGGAVLLGNSEGNSLKEILSDNSSDIIAKSFNQESDTFQYRNKEITIQSPSISMAYLTQLHLLLDIYCGKRSKRLHESGITARVIPYIHPDRNITVNQHGFGDTRISQEMYNDHIIKILNFFCTTDQDAEKYHIRLSRGAQRLVFQFREQCNSRLYEGEMQYWIAKAPGHAVRVAAAFHFWRHGENGIHKEICEEDLQLAIALVQESEQHAQYLYDPYGMEAEQNSKKIITNLRRITDNAQIGNILQNGLTTTEINQRTKIDRLAINNAFYRMQQAKWAVVWDNGSGNMIIRFRPEIFEWQYTVPPYAGFNNPQLISAQF